MDLQPHTHTHTPNFDVFNPIRNVLPNSHKSYPSKNYNLFSFASLKRRCYGFILTFREEEMGGIYNTSHQLLISFISNWSVDYVFWLIVSIYGQCQKIMKNAQRPRWFLQMNTFWPSVPKIFIYNWEKQQILTLNKSKPENMRLIVSALYHTTTNKCVK